jgi:hypothetical protein
MHELGQPPDEIVRNLGLNTPFNNETTLPLSEDLTKKKDESKDDRDCSIM